jgi:serine phosphatase RsbU (regulator of sigma subunit)
MSRLKKILYVTASLVVFVTVFILDVIRHAVSFDLDGILYIREGAIVCALFLLYLYIRAAHAERPSGIPKNIGKLLIYSLLVLFLASLVSFVGRGTTAPDGTITPPQAALTSLLSVVFGVVLGLFSISVLLTIKDLLLHKRRKGTKRNFIIYVVVLLLSSLTVLPLIPAELSVISSILFAVAVVMIVVNSFKQNWIVYLSRREKLYSIVYSALLFLTFIGLSLLITQHPVARALDTFHLPLRNFAQLNAIFGAVYFGMAFISTLFHLPTAEVYERKQSELTSLHNLSRLVTQVFDFSDLVNTVTAMTLEVVGARSAWLELIRERGTNGQVAVDVVSNRNISPEQIELITASEESSLRKYVLDSKRALLIDDIRNDRRTKHITKSGVTVGSLLSVPLVSHGEPIGFLHATKDFEFGFDQDDIDVMTTFADHVTIAIENSKLIAKSLERERYQQEMMVAQQMQKRLLPQRLPKHPSLQIAAVSEPSLEVGGDYYDFVQLKGDRLGVVVGDVSGKGVSAAFYMAEVKGIFQSLSKICDSPRELLLRANQSLVESLEHKAFISLLYGIIDIPKGTLTLARAGHCPMIHVSGLHAQMIRPTGIGLGLTHEQIFEETIQEAEIQLQKDDLCIFYTDGLNESRNAEGEEFGFERLVQAALGARFLSAEQIKETILTEIRNHTGDSAYGDDMTLVVIKWLGHGEG